MNAHDYALQANGSFALPDACFKATAERSPDIDVNVINKDIAKFMEDQNAKKHSR